MTPAGESSAARSDDHSDGICCEWAGLPKCDGSCTRPASSPPGVPSPPKPSAAQDLDRLSDIDTEQAIHALARLRGNAADKQLIAHTIGLLGGRIVFLLDVPEIAAAIERNRRGR